MNAIKMGMTIEEAAETSGIGRNTCLLYTSVVDPASWCKPLKVTNSYKAYDTMIFPSRQGLNCKQTLL